MIRTSRRRVGFAATSRGGATRPGQPTDLTCRPCPRGRATPPQRSLRSSSSALEARGPPTCVRVPRGRTTEGAANPGEVSGHAHQPCATPRVDVTSTRRRSTEAVRCQARGVQAGVVSVHLRRTLTAYPSAGVPGQRRWSVILAISGSSSAECICALPRGWLRSAMWASTAAAGTASLGRNTSSGFTFGTGHRRDHGRRVDLRRRSGDRGRSLPL